MERIADGEIEGDEGVFCERLAGCEVGALGCGAEGENVVCGGEGGETVVKGGVCEGDCTAAEDGCLWRGCKWKVFWYWIRYLGR